MNTALHNLLWHSIMIRTNQR